MDIIGKQNGNGILPLALIQNGRGKMTPTQRPFVPHTQLLPVSLYSTKIHNVKRIMQYRAWGKGQRVRIFKPSALCSLPSAPTKEAVCL